MKTLPRKVSLSSLSCPTFMLKFISSLTTTTLQPNKWFL